ncbi:hypothetical protein M8J75_013076 [Diaphorina citri]|nr:hypothetical protein M8J75_013076 [Diaphorina citri]
MGKTREIPIQTRGEIIGLHKANVSNRQIANKLRISRRTVDNIVKKFKDHDTVLNKKRSGRPKVTTSREDLKIKICSLRNRQLTAPQITADFNQGRDKSVSVSTIKRRLQKSGLNGRIAVSKPLLRPINKKKRLSWAQNHKDWTIDQWKKVLWSDESKFEIFGSKRRVFVRRRPGERVAEGCTVASVKHGGGSVMVWGCFGGSGVGDLVRIEGIMRKEEYKKILEDNVVPSGTNLIGNGFIFQHDNDPKHTSKLCKGFLASQEQQSVLKVMEWPPQSPDCNPIELLWDHLDRQVRKSCPTSQSDLMRILREEWAKIPQTTLEKLIQRLPRICKEIIKNKGGHIDEAKV